MIATFLASIVLIIGALGLVVGFISWVRFIAYKKCKECGSDNLYKYSSLSGNGAVCRDCHKDVLFKDADGYLNDVI